MKDLRKYICLICTYEYDPAKGDPERGIPGNTPFEALPDGWTCPTCGAGKEHFMPMSGEDAP